MDDRSPEQRARLSKFIEYRQNPSIRAERYCAKLFEAAMTARQVEERDSFTCLLLRYFEWIFRCEDPLPEEFDYERGACGGFIFLCYSLTNPACRDLTWEWMHRLIQRASKNESYQEAIVIGVFERTAQYPLELNVSEEAIFVDRWLRCYENPETRWVVHRAYHWCARKLEGDLWAHAAWCEQQGLPPIDFKLGEVCSWIVQRVREDPESQAEPFNHS